MPDHYDIATFRDRHFDYQRGHHLAAFGPTQKAGKSTLTFYLLDQVIDWYPEICPTVLNMKHKDRVVAGWTQRLGFQETPRWPAQRKLSNWHPRGHTLWPRQTLSNVDLDNATLEREFKAAITHNRKHTPSITVANELYGLIAELHMRTLLTAVVTRDSVAGHGLWYESQKPSGTQGVSIPGFFFNSAEHMFLAQDGEARNRQRYAEISCGIDEREIERETLRLDPFSWLYVRRTGPEWCVVDAYDPALAILAA